MNKSKFYPLADYHRWNLSLPSLGYSSNQIMAQWDGLPRRCPKAGEWYLSGAIVEAYRAKNDMSTPYHIAKLFKVKRETVTVVTPIEEIK